MCSLNENDLEVKDQCMGEKSVNVVLGPQTVCKKCRQNTADLVLRIRDAYCRECFLIATVHKFRALLGKSRLVRPKERVLIGFSGSQSSAALLHLIYEGINVATHKRLLFHPSVLYIDEGAILGLSQDERHTICASISKCVQKFDFPTYMVTLDKSLDDPMEIKPTLSTTDSEHLIDINEEDDLKLKNVVDATCSLTAKEDLVQILRNKLLLTVAKHLKCPKIFVADVETDLAIKLLSNISLGRGAQLPLDVGFCDARDPEVKVLRPMRDFMKKEIAFYNYFMKLDSIFIPSLGTKGDSHASIQKLTEKFITELQNDFPGTVSTVFRTGEKLSLSDDSGTPDESCALCQAPLDTANLESSALQATEFSRMISTLGPAGFDNMSIGETPMVVPKKEIVIASLRKSCGGGSGDCGCHATGCSERGVTWAEAVEFLCYGCRLICREVERPFDQLPSVVVQAVRERAAYKLMRNEIQDFLL